MIVLLYRVNEHKWAKSIVLCCLLLHCITLNTYTVPDLCNKHFKCAIFVCVKLLFIIIIVSIWKVWTHACHCSLWLVRTASVWTFISIHIQSPVMNDMVLWPQKTNHLSSRAVNKEMWFIQFLFTFPWLWYGQLATFCIVVMCTHWRITNVILCLIWIHVLTKRCRARQRCLRLFPDHLGLGQLCLLSMRSMTTERLNLYSANDFVLARCGFVRFIALSFDVLSQPKKNPSSNPDYKDTL